MIGRLMNNEETNAALVVALSGAIAVLVAGGQGPLSAGRVLSNPVPRSTPSGVSPTRAADRRAA